MDGTNPSCDAMLALISLKVLVGFRVIFPELFDDILARIAVVLLDLACDPQLIFWRDGSHFTTLTHQVQHEL